MKKECCICGKTFNALHRKNKCCSLKCGSMSCSRTSTGKKVSPERRLFLVGLLNKHRIKHHTEESKKKMSLRRKGIVFSPETLKRMSEAQKGRRHPESVKMKIAMAQTGEKSHCWRGGISPIRKILRESARYKNWRLEVFKRDKYACKKCGIVRNSIEAHHEIKFIDLIHEAKNKYPLFSVYCACMMYDKLWDIDNGTTLCKKCHESIGGYHNERRC